MVLTQKQLKVVKSKAQHALVLAGHGTGKTRVLAHYALERARSIPSRENSDGSLDPIILVLSHTTHARDEIKKQIIKLEPKAAVRNRICCMTFHGYALKMIGQYAAQYKFRPEFSNTIVKRFLSKSMYPKRPSVRLVDDVVSLFEEHGRFKMSIRTLIAKRYPGLRNKVALVRKCFRQFERKRHQKKIITLNDLPSTFVKLVGNGDISKDFSRGVEALVVDEFQDTLSSQWKMLQFIAHNHMKVLVAGDPGQAIFVWAGASTVRFDQFRRKYPRHEEYHLTKNFRSSKPIVELCKAILNQCPDIEKVVNKSKKPGALPLVVCKPSKSEIAHAAVKEIIGFKMDGGSIGDCGVIYRFHNDKRLLTRCLEDAGIPYRVFEKRARRKNPLVRLIFSLNNIVNAIGGNVTAKSTWNDWREVLQYVKGVGVQNTTEIINWLKSTQMKNPIYPKPLQFRDALQSLIHNLRRVAHKTLDSDAPNRLGAIERLIDQLPKVNRSDKVKERASLYYFAHTSESMTEVEEKYYDPAEPTYYPAGRCKPPFPEEYVTLSTVHKIKGGEFEKVLYLGTDDYLYKKYRSLKGKNKQAETLLMNVACSRAGSELTLLFPIDGAQWESGLAAANPWTIIRKVPKDQLKLKVL